MLHLRNMGYWCRAGIAISHCQHGFERPWYPRRPEEQNFVSVAHPPDFQGELRLRFCPDVSPMADGVQATSATTHSVLRGNLE